MIGLLERSVMIGLLERSSVMIGLLERDLL